MLKKLIKHDIKNMTKILVYMYAISLILSVLTRLINIGKEIEIIKIIGIVFQGLSISAVCTILVNTFVHTIRVFIQSFYKDESYLTHTLPVKKETLLLSKYISSLIVIISSIFVCALSLFIIFYDKSFFANIKSFLDLTLSEFSLSTGLIVTLLLLTIFAEFCAYLSMGFAAIIKGNSYNTKRTIKGFKWFAIYYLCSFAATMIISVIAFAASGNISQFLSNSLNQTALLILLIVALVVYIGTSIAFYFIGQREFKKGVNVD